MNKFLRKRISLNQNGIIYKITNLINLKVYIGQTKQTLKRRWIQHKSCARTGELAPLYNSMRYQGIDKFEIEIIDKVPFNLLDKKEIEYIKLYKSNIQEHGNRFGYNQDAGGSGGKNKNIETEVLKDLIIQGYSLNDILKELKIGKTALYTKCNEVWGLTLRDVRHYLMKFEIKRLIIKGYNGIQISEKIGRNRSFIYNILYNDWGIDSISEAKRFFLKHLIKEKLSRGVLLKDIAHGLDISRRIISSYINEYWNKTYSDAKYYFMKLRIKSMIERGFSLTKITKQLAVKYFSTIHRYIKRFWDMNYLEARDEFFIKPLLISMIKEDYERDEMAVEFSVRPDTINELCKRFWNNTFTNTRLYY
ncbi:MAG: GIY-YIG nuclease family protein [Promethearchaeota archaeon]|nr:MAG: GIY-YIG nuclease family protein [Candidatus Lokiarchaeota archaeon]